MKSYPFVAIKLMTAVKMLMNYLYAAKRLIKWGAAKKLLNVLNARRSNLVSIVRNNNHS